MAHTLPSHDTKIVKQSEGLPFPLFRQAHASLVPATVMPAEPNGGWGDQE